MPSLRELQSRMMDALAGDTADGALSLIDLPGEAARSRLAVYRNNAQAHVVNALRSTYPAVRRLVGDGYFLKVAQDFARLEPSRSGDLAQMGRGFEDYLTQRHRANEFRYLADVARLEWLIHDALRARDHAPLDITKLASVAPSTYAGMHFTLHPTLRLFESDYPIHRIWEANVANDAEPEWIDLTTGSDRLAVMRPGSQLRFHPLSRAEFCLLTCLERGEPFVRSVDAAVVAAAGAGDSTFDAATALRRFVSIHAIADFDVRR